MFIAIAVFDSYIYLILTLPSWTPSWPKEDPLWSIKWKEGSNSPQKCYSGNSPTFPEKNQHKFLRILAAWDPLGWRMLTMGFFLWIQNGVKTTNDLEYQTWNLLLKVIFYGFCQGKSPFLSPLFGRICFWFFFQATYANPSKFSVWILIKKIQRYQNGFFKVKGPF